ncbi:low molecular weight protein-tyrosine-phosphatase [Dermabacteraceae bacterium P13101]
MTMRIVTVCTGNICRSPMAEYMLREAALREGLAVEVDSAAITGWEVGNPMDRRAQAVLRENGIDPSGHSARKLGRAEIADYDLLLAMDTDHYEAMRRMAGSDEERAKVRLMREFDPAAREGELGIEDPYYGSDEGFAETYRLLAAAIPGVLAYVRENG